MKVNVSISAPLNNKLRIQDISFYFLFFRRVTIVRPQGNSKVIRMENKGKEIVAQIRNWGLLILSGT